ncbi:MAG TPA: hypothetical protein VG055_01180 [Planctomycetaceae bacterium]|jgi:hypothetical protein|nr:hypothetical protein [Planctomycetaceae bacterium]
MFFSSWLRNWKRSPSAPHRRTATPPRRRAGFRQPVEALEDRCLLSALTVTNIQDKGHGSLRAEIAAARSGDTIVFSPQLDGKTIMLTTGQLDITKNLTIQGPGAGQLIISGGIYGDPYNRVFEVAPNTTVSLSGLTISHGTGYKSVGSRFAMWDGYGGAILNLGTLKVSACTISYSHALNEGGGIFNDGILTVSSSTFSGNGAADGAGMWNLGTATLVSSTIFNNQALDTSPGSYQPDGVGGGIYNHGMLTLSSCTVSANYSNGVAGGICNDASGTVTVENSSSVTEDVYNLGVLYLDSTSTIGILEGNPAIPISSSGNAAVSGDGLVSTGAIANVTKSTASQTEATGNSLLNSSTGAEAQVPEAAEQRLRSSNDAAASDAFDLVFVNFKDELLQLV